MRPFLRKRWEMELVRYEYFGMTPPMMQKSPSEEEDREDEDVALERSRIDAGGDLVSEDVIVARSLRKTFRRNVDMSNRVRVMREVDTTTPLYRSGSARHLGSVEYPTKI